MNIVKPDEDTSNIAAEQTAGSPTDTDRVTTESKISHYETLDPSSFKGDISLEEAVRRIQSDEYKPQTIHLRSLSNKKERKVYKEKTFKVLLGLESSRVAVRQVI